MIEMIHITDHICYFQVPYKDIFVGIYVLHTDKGMVLLGTLQAVTIPGHAADSAALFDLRTNTLVSGDCLQSFGIFGSGCWYGNITLPGKYFAAIEKLQALPIDRIATAHDYHPCGIVSIGRAAVTAWLDSCIDALRRVQTVMQKNPEPDDTQIARLCNDGKPPKVASAVVAALRSAAADGTI